MTSPAPPPSPAHETDEALVARLGQGDEHALRVLHRRYAAFVFTLAARVVDEGTAEEVVQDVFVTLWKKHEAFDPARGSFKRWIARIARNHAINARRGAPAPGAVGDEALDDLAADLPDPDEAQWIEHRRAVVRAAVDALPPAQRKALSLAYFDDLTHEQIARALDAPVGTTKSRIRMGLKHLGPVLIAALAATAVLVAFVWREERAARNERALRMVTASDVVPIRLGPAPGAPAEAHGNYRTRPGAGVAVLTTNHLPPLAAGERYFAWARWDRGFCLLGRVVVEDDGRSLLVSDVGSEKEAPVEIRVTREPAAGDAPQGPAVILWSREPL